jgi:hypothetical protein
MSRVLGSGAMGALAAALVLAGCTSQGRTSPKMPGTDPYLQAVNSDLAEAARSFVEGRLTGRQYLDLSSDRAAKARRYRDDPSWRAAAKQGDWDQDRVPDPLDSCSSPYLTPTDEKGCPPPTRPECVPGQVPCPETGPDDDAKVRGLLDQATLLFNPACDGAPAPRASNPLTWGHGSLEARNTFFLVVGKAGSMPPGCDLFYEMEFRIEVLHLGPNPLVRYITVLFRGAEDLTPLDPRRAVFSLPLEETGKPARGDLWGALTNAGSVRWRVRALNGAQATSPWSVMTPKNPTAGGLSF